MPSKIKNITSGFNIMPMNEEDSISVETEIKELVEDMINSIENSEESPSQIFNNPNLHLHYCFEQILSNLEYLNDQIEKYSDFHLITVFDMIKNILSQIKTENATFIYNFLLENDVLTFLLITLSKLTQYWTPFINIEILTVLHAQNYDDIKFEEPQCITIIRLVTEMIKKFNYCQEKPDLFYALISSSCLFDIINENLINNSVEHFISHGEIYKAFFAFIEAVMEHIKLREKFQLTIMLDKMTQMNELFATYKYLERDDVNAILIVLRYNIDLLKLKMSHENEIFSDDFDDLIYEAEENGNDNEN